MVITTINDLLVKILMDHNWKLLAMSDFKGYYLLINDTSLICSQFCRYLFYCLLQDTKTSYYKWRRHYKECEIGAYFLGVLHFVACQLACISIYLSHISIWFLIRHFMCFEISCWNCILKSNACFWERLIDVNLKYLF